MVGVVVDVAVVDVVAVVGEAMVVRGLMSRTPVVVVVGAGEVAVVCIAG